MKKPNFSLEKLDKNAFVALDNTDKQVLRMVGGKCSRHHDTDVGDDCSNHHDTDTPAIAR